MTGYRPMTLADLAGHLARVAPITGDGNPVLCGICDGTYVAGLRRTCGVRNAARNADGDCKLCARNQSRQTFGEPACFPGRRTR